MLKWLRKYNTVILVIGGILLMIAFLMPQTIEQCGRSPLGAAVMRMDGSRVSLEEFAEAQKEYYALSTLFPGAAGENAEHWLMLTHEAAKGGYLAGKHDGPTFLEKSARELARFQLFQQNPWSQPDPQQVETFGKQFADSLLTVALPRAMRDARLSEDDVFRALGKLHGVIRMRNLYNNGPRFSDRRLASSLKSTDDAATIDYLFIPPDRELPSIPEPDATALTEFFDKYKSVKPGEGEYGFGYLQPDRVKLAWLFVDRNAVLQGITPDPVEVRKRFFKAHPTGKPPEGQSEQAIMTGLESAVRSEQTAAALKAIDAVVRTEFDRATRRLEADGEYKKLPTGWTAPDLERIRELVPVRVKEQTGMTVPPPAVTVKSAAWLTREDVGQLEGIGSSFIARGDATELFVDAVFKVRELAGKSATLLQVGVPSLDRPTSQDGGSFYFVVLDAKKESVPESIDEIRDKVVTDYKRLKAYEILKGKEAGFREIAISLGIETLAKSPTPDGSGDLPITPGVRVDGNAVGNGDARVNTPEFRKAVLAAAAKLDPLTDIATLDLGQRTVVVPVARSQGVAVARINSVSPLTVERFRTSQSQAINAIFNEFRKDIDSDPFSRKRLEQRLSVEYLDGRQAEQPEDAAAGANKPAA